MKITIQYKIHQLLQSKYKLIIYVLVYLIIYLYFSSPKIVSCMNESVDQYYQRQINDLVIENRRLTASNTSLAREYNDLVAYTKDLHQQLFQVQTEKNHLILKYRAELAQYKAQLHEANLKRLYYREIVSEHERGYQIVVNEKEALAKELQNAYQKITRLTDKNLRLHLDLIQATHNSESQYSFTRSLSDSNR